MMESGGGGRRVAPVERTGDGQEIRLTERVIEWNRPTAVSYVSHDDVVEAWQNGCGMPSGPWQAATRRVGLRGVRQREWVLGDWRMVMAVTSELDRTPQDGCGQTARRKAVCGPMQVERAPGDGKRAGRETGTRTMNGIGQHRDLGQAPQSGSGQTAQTGTGTTGQQWSNAEVGSGATMRLRADGEMGSGTGGRHCESNENRIEPRRTAVGKQRKRYRTPLDDAGITARTGSGIE
jgi:hypothetical protein